MRHFYLFVGAILTLGACGSSEDTDPVDTITDDTNDGACGDVSEHNVHVIISVTEDGVPAEGADVSLVEDAWHTPEKSWYGGVTDANGIIEFDAPNIVSVEECWGIALYYIATAQKGAELYGETDMNSSLYGAITDEDYLADVSLFPIELD